MSSFTTILNTIVAAGCLFLAGTIGIWVIDNHPPVTIHSAEAVEPVVEPGGLLKIRFRVHRNRICHVRLQQVVVDSQSLRENAPEQDYTLDPGVLGEDVFVLGMRLPNHLAEGEAVYESFRSYTCNPIHSWFFKPIPLVGPEVKFMIRKP